jgi:hypothetical protein
MVRGIALNLHQTREIDHMRFNIDAAYIVSSNVDVDLPVEDWTDIKEWYIKWNIFYYMLEGDNEYREYDLGDIDLDSLDMKRPSDVTVHQLHDNGIIDYEMQCV